MNKAVQENLKAESQCLKTKQLVRPLCNSGSTLLLDKGGLGIKHQTAISAFGVLPQLVGKDCPFLAAGGAFNFNFTQGLVGFKPWTVLVAHVASFFFPGCGLRLTRPSSDQPHFHYRLKKISFPALKATRVMQNSTRQPDLPIFFNNISLSSSRPSNSIITGGLIQTILFHLHPPLIETVSPGLAKPPMESIA